MPGSCVTKSVLVGSLALVLAHYVWTAAPNQSFYAFEHYHLLTDAFIAGRLSLLVPPSPGLVSLPDPYDPVANARYRVYPDCSLFEGKYYLYFGVAPALTLFIPYRLLFGAHLPEKYAAVLFMFGGVLFCVDTVLRLKQRFYRDAPFGIVLLVVILLAFSNFAPFILRRPIVYEVAVAAGFFFLAAAVAFVLRGLLAQRPPPALLALGSLCLGLASGSRPHHVLAAPFLALACVWLYRERKGPTWRHGIALGLPFLLCGLGLLLYNYARYGAWLEFGQSYVIDAYNHPRTTLFSLSYLPSHLFINFLAPPSVDFDFPFFHMYPALFPELPHSRSVFESVAGALPAVPIMGLAFLSPVFLHPRLRGGVPILPLIAAVGFAALGLLLLGFISCFLVASVRYFVDFCPWLLLSSTLVWLHLDHLSRGRTASRAALNSIVVLLLLYGTVVNLGVGLTGYYDLFRKRQPEAYAAIEDRFFPLQRLLLALGPGHGDIKMKVRFPAASTGVAEALITVGHAPKVDVLCVRRLEDSRVVFRFHHSGAPAQRSAAVSIEADRTYVLEVSMGSLLPHTNVRVLSKLFPNPTGEDPRRRLSVRLDGEEILHGEFDFEPLSPSLVTVAHGSADPQHCAAPFSGTVTEVRREVGQGKSR